MEVHCCPRRHAGRLNVQADTNPLAAHVKSGIDDNLDRCSVDTLVIFQGEPARGQ